MLKIFTAAAKELLLLKRDRTGLLVLFIMPAILVMVITLVQENVMELTGQKKTRILFLDLDNGDLGRSLRQHLEEGHLEIVDWGEKQKNSKDVQAAVIGGDYQVGIVIPEDSSVKFHEETARIFQNAGQQDAGYLPEQIPVQVFFDPGVMPGFRSGLTARLQIALETIGMAAKIGNLGRVLNSLLENFGVPQDVAGLPVADFAGLIGQPLFSLEDKNDNSWSIEMARYNPVQQNVPAWALFGMFFTAIPIAGTILQERKSGIWVRVTSLPVSHLLLFTGKVLAYVGVCCFQFLLVALIGSFLFPYIGLPAFIVSPNFAEVLLTVFVSSLAVCGFGIFLGMVCSTYEQASTLGSTAVVAAAAIGGVMVPVYAMPPVMQQLSITSPLNWGLTAFHDLLIRGYSFSAVLDDLGRLALFFFLTLLLAWKLARTPG